jgi:hypothetical protein
MLISTAEIKQLARSLGSLEGLRRVNSEIDLLNVRLATKDLQLSYAELRRMGEALVSLSHAIGEMRRITRLILAEAGVISNYVG